MSEKEAQASSEQLLRTVIEVLSALRDVLNLKDVKVHDDIRRGKTIISDAVVKLGNSFNGLNTQTRAQQQLVASLMDEVSQDGASKPRTNRSSVKEIADGMSAILQGFLNTLDQVSAQSSGVIAKMEAMTDVVNQTFSLIGHVEMITKQTNLLSLNAFIEAARSGEAGRGFQVVATEMRNLSQSSAKMNEQIRSQVERSKKIVRETRDVVNQMAMRDMGSLIEAKDRADLLFAKLAVMNQFISENLGQVSDLTRGIDRSVGLAVQSLQFEDIVGQLLSHADRELSEQEQGLVDVYDRLDRFVETAQSGGNPQIALLELNSGLQPLRGTSLIKKSAAVLQQSMDEGDIELF
ncbi:MAG: methyl-accepting chemotaxis protein [Candidatus Competibacteraceae bacterium]